MVIILSGHILLYMSRTFYEYLPQELFLLKNRFFMLVIHSRSFRVSKAGEDTKLLMQQHGAHMVVNFNRRPL